MKEGPEKLRKPEELAQIRSYYLENVCYSTRDAFTSVNEDLEKIRNEKAAFDASIPSTFVFKDLAKPRESFVMIRGEYDKPGERVEPNTPLVLPPLQKDGARANRLDLAKWLMAPENPLTATRAVSAPG